MAWYGDASEGILRLCLPYLVLKKTQAEIILKLIESKRLLKQSMGRDGKFRKSRPLPSALIEERESAFEKMRTLNAKGMPSN